MITYYVNTASSGGNGTTKALSGASAAFASVYSAIAALVATPKADDVTLSCVGAAAEPYNWDFSNDIFSAASKTLTITGDRTSAAGFHGGKYNASAYRQSISGGIGVNINFMGLSHPFAIVVDGVQFVQTGAARQFQVQNSGQTVTVENCLFRLYAGASQGVYLYASGATVIIDNNTFGGVGGGSEVGIDVEAGSAAVYCNAFLGLAQGIVCNGGTVTAIDNANAASVAFSPSGSGTITADYNASAEGYGTHATTITNWAAQFSDSSYAADCNSALTVGGALRGAGIFNGSVPTTDMLGMARGPAITDLGSLVYEAAPEFSDERHYYALKKIWPLKALDGDPVYEADTHIEGKYLDQAYDQGTALASELFPDTSTACLADWDRVCAVTPTGSVATQQAACASQMCARGGLSREYFIGIARAMGYSGCQILEGETLQFVVASESPPATQLPAKLFDPDEAYRWWMRIPAAQAPTGAPALLAKLQDLAPAWTLPGIGAPL